LPRKLSLAVSGLAAAVTLAWMAWQMIRLWWFPALSDGPGPGLAPWVMGFFLLFAPMLVAGTFVMSGSEFGDELLLRLVPVFFLVVWCLGAGSVAVYAASDLDGRLVPSYLLMAVTRIVSLFVSIASSPEPRDDAVGGTMKRWGVEVGLFLLFTFAALFLPVPEGRVERTPTGRGMFEQNPELPLAAMSAYFVALAAIELFALRRGLRSTGE
jgi:hypothetical protein